METIIIWIIAAIALFLLILIMFVALVIIGKKTHALIEFKSGMKGTPISIFFHDNRYCEWKNTKPDAGLIEDKVDGTFVIDSTYIDKKTKNVLIPFNSTFGMSLNAKASKLADDLTFILKEKDQRKKLKEGVLTGQISENETLKTLRTSINFSTLKHFVSPVLPQNIQSKIVNTVYLRTKSKGITNFQNMILLITAIIGALILGGIVLRYALTAGGVA